MPNNPENYGFITYLWVLLLSVWGGSVHYLGSLKQEIDKKFSAVDWLYDVIVSGFVGVITFYLCEYYMLEQVLTAAFVGVSAHMGTRSLVIVKNVIIKNIPVKGE